MIKLIFKKQSPILSLDSKKDERIAELIKLHDMYLITDQELPIFPECQCPEISGTIINQETNEGFFFRAWHVLRGWWIGTLHSNNEEKNAIQCPATIRELHLIILTYCYARRNPRRLSEDAILDYIYKEA